MAQQKYGLTDEIQKRKNALDTSIYGNSPQDYKGTFEQAYKGMDQGPNANPDIISSGTKELADRFIERYYERNGAMPDENTVRDFVSSNLDQNFASNYIKGTMNGDQVKSQLVDPYLNSNNLAGGTDPTGVEGRMNDLNSKLDQYYQGAGNYAQTNINNEFNRQKTNVANDLAGAGLLNSGVSRYSLNDLEGQRGQAQASAQATLASQKAAGQIDLSKTIENIMAGQRGLQQGANQFQQNLQFSKNQYQNQLDMQNKQLSLAARLGQLQAGQKSNGISGAIGGGLAGAGSGALIGSAVPGIGTAIGAGAGFLAGAAGGYLGSRS